MTTANRAPHPQIEKTILDPETPEKERRRLVDEELARLNKEYQQLSDLADDYARPLSEDLVRWFEDIRVYRNYILKLLESDIPL